MDPILDGNNLEFNNSKEDTTCKAKDLNNLTLCLPRRRSIPKFTETIHVVNKKTRVHPRAIHLIIIKNLNVKV